LDGITGLQAARRKPDDRENLDQESIVLAICRLTKRGDELRSVVVLKIIQWSKERVHTPLWKCCRGYSRTCGFIAKTE